MSRLAEDIAAVEGRLAVERAELSAAWHACGEDLRDHLASLRGLAVVVAVGFIVGAIAQRRQPAMPPSPAVGPLALALGIAGGIVRGRYGGIGKLAEKLFATHRREPVLEQERGGAT